MMTMGRVNFLLFFLYFLCAYDDMSVSYMQLIYIEPMYCNEDSPSGGNSSAAHICIMKQTIHGDFNYSLTLLHNC